MKITVICLVITAAVSVVLLCANFFLIFRHFSAKKIREEEKRKTALLLSTTAHDLRSPLSGIKGFADALLDGTVSEEKRGEYLALISSEAQRLARITGRLCESDDAKLSARVFGLCEAVRRAFLLVGKKAGMRGINVDFSFTDDDEFYVIADPDAVFEIVFNLFENAVKYCDDNGTISWKLVPDGNFVDLTVKNTTDLLPEIPDIFAVGARGENKNVQGFGLGLYISQKLAKKCNTELVFDKGTDEKGNFCTFSMKLPIADEI